MRERGIALEVRVTWEAGDAKRYVSEAIADGVHTLIAAGGDGTLSEVATALADRDEPADDLPALGLVPLGTANDFANAAQVPLEPLPALEMIANASSTPIDLLKLIAGDGGTHWCANLASGGFGTQVTVETDEGLKKMLGGLAYLITGISKLAASSPCRQACVARNSSGKATSSHWAWAMAGRPVAARCCARKRSSTTACWT